MLRRAGHPASVRYLTSPRRRRQKNLCVVCTVLPRLKLVEPTKLGTCSRAIQSANHSQTSSFLAKPTSGTLPALKDTPISVDLQAGEGFPDTPICNRSLVSRLGRAFKTIRMDGFLRLRNPLTGARLRSLLFLRLSASPGTCKGESKKLPVDRASGERRFGAGRDIFYVRKKT